MNKVKRAYKLVYKYFLYKNLCKRSYFRKHIYYTDFKTSEKK